MELQWTPNAHVSAIHTAWCVAHFPKCAARLNSEWPSVAAALDELAGEFKTTRGKYWEQMLSLAATADGSRELADRLCGRLGQTSGTLPSGTLPSGTLPSGTQTSGTQTSGTQTSGTLPSRLAATLNQCRRQFESSYPKFASEIPLRTGPIRQMWQAHGVGLMNILGRQTGGDVLVEQASVLLVQPVLGGFGYAHLAANRIHWEAMLTHADPQLPETLRIAWLLSQLDLDRPLYSDNINAHRLRSVAGLAMLPAILEAGQELELCRYSPESLASALRLWHCDTLQLDIAKTLAVVGTWWETYQASRPAWRVALTALDQMLPQVGS